MDHAILTEQLIAAPDLGTAAGGLGEYAPPVRVTAAAARAVLGLPADGACPVLPAWLAPHQVPAVRRLLALLDRYGGAVLADAPGLGKSYVATAVARVRREPLMVLAPAVLVAQWRDLLARLGVRAPIVTHERLSGRRAPDPGPARCVVVDEAHRFRNPDTRRYRALARVAIGRRLLLVSATPVHNRLGDLLHLLRLFLRDDALTALGVGSLRRAARGEEPGSAVRAAVARLVVARSRGRARAAAPALSFPRRGRDAVRRVGPAPPAVLEDLVTRSDALAPAGPHGALTRLLLLSRLASSLPALRATLARLEAFADVATLAAAEGRFLRPADFRRLCGPDEGADVQLALFSLLLDPGSAAAHPPVAALRELRAAAADAPDPKAAALDTLLAERPGRTIVFTTARATAHHLARLLGRRYRVAVVTGAGGAWAAQRVPRDAVLRAFAPRARGAPPPPATLVTDVLIATDLVSEGLDLQDARRVVHYDLPWTPARLAQRVGRVDRLGSPHDTIETVTFLPPPCIAERLAIAARLARKARAQRAAGAAGLETLRGALAGGGLDWCDRLQQLAGGGAVASPGAWTAVREGDGAVVLVVRLGGADGPVETVVVDRAGARADPVRATALLERAVRRTPAQADSDVVRAALARAAPLLTERRRAVDAARWRAADRDGMGRRLVPWALTAARRAARQGDAGRLARLDGLVARLTRGMTAGEELLLGRLLEQRRPLRVDDVLAWHESLPPLAPQPDGPGLTLVAAVVVGWSERLSQDRTQRVESGGAFGISPPIRPPTTPPAVAPNSPSPIPG